MNTTTLYPVAQEDWYRARRVLRLAKGGVRAVWTGEKRAPRKGEWFLSGSIVEAYYAHSDLGTVYHIAKIVEVETKTIVVSR